MSRESRVLISLGLVLDTDIRRAVGAFCAALKISPEVAGPIFQSRELQELIQSYKEGRFETPDFFDWLKSIIRTKGVATAEADAADPDWALKAWNAQTKLDEGRLAQISRVLGRSELYVYSDTNPAQIEQLGGVDVLCGRMGIPASKIFISYQLKHLGAYQDAFTACFAEQNPDKRVALITGPTPALQSQVEAALYRSMLEKALSTEGGKDAAHVVEWNGKANLAALIEKATHPAAVSGLRR